MPDNDLVRVRHMLDAARTAAALTSGKTRDDLDQDIALQLALVKLIEIIGEAASRVSVEYRATQPGIPWQKIVGMRHRLIHAYFDVNRDVVWSTIVEDLPPLATQLAAILDRN